MTSPTGPGSRYKSSPFDEDHQTFRQTCRRFVAEKVTPRIDEWEEQKGFDRKIFCEMGEMGLLGIAFPEEYGGSALDFWYSVVWMEELSRCGAAGFPMGTMVHSYMATPPIERFGSPELKQRLLPSILAGEKITALAISEPGAGSDVASIRTTAIREGDHYLVNGSKTFITNGTVADLLTLAVKTDPTQSHAGVSVLVFETDTPGFSIGKKLEKLGCHSSDTAELSFENCRVPVGNRLGKEGQGFYIIMDNFQQERLVGAISAVTGSEMILAQTLEYARTRKAFGRPIAHFQVQRHRFAEIATRLEAARQMAYHAAGLFAAGENAVREISMAKLFCCETATWIADQCLQAYGGWGYMEEYPASRALRDTRLLTIGGGTSEIMREIISRIVIDGKEYLTPDTEALEESAKRTERTVTEIFETLPSRFQADRANDLREIYQFAISGADGGHWTVQIADGALSVQKGDHGEPSCTVETDAETYVAIETGHLQPQEAFLSGRIVVDNVPAMMALAGTLERIS